MTKAGEHVLVVDDEPQILRALGVILRNAGYEVATAATKSEALDAVSDGMPADFVAMTLYAALGALREGGQN